VTNLGREKYLEVKKDDVASSIALKINDDNKL